MENLKQLVKLHPEAKEISFLHKFVIQHTFKKSILGTLGIHYFSLMIIDPSNTLSIYSSAPALEYNMIHHNLWHYDGIFELKNHKDGAFIFWDELYATCLKNTLISEKERKFGFSFGFFIMRKINNLFTIYSFATKNHNGRERFLQSKNILLQMGDYFFEELKDIHQQYMIPKSTLLLPIRKTGICKLIIDNTK